MHSMQDTCAVLVSRKKSETNQTMAAYSSHIDNEDDSIPDEDEIILFQCKTCNAVLADSTDSSGANSELGLVVLKSFPETVTQDEECSDEDENENTGCDYSVLYCAACDTVVGKFYKKVTEELSELQNQATLNLGQLNFYTIDGSKFGRNVPDRPSPQPECPPSLGDVAPTGQLKELQDAIGKLNGDIGQIQFVMCTLDERLRQIEKHLRLPEMKVHGPDTSNDISVRSCNVTLNSTASKRSDNSSAHRQSQGRRGDTSGRNVSYTNSHTNSLGGETFLLDTTTSHSRLGRHDSSRARESDGEGDVETMGPGASGQGDMTKEDSFSHRSFSKPLLEPYKHRRPDHVSKTDGHTKRTQKRKNVGQEVWDTASKKRRNNSDVYFLDH